jgi:hypothetical protein
LKISYSVHRDLNVRANNERSWDYTAGAGAGPTPAAPAANGAAGDAYSAPSHDAHDVVVTGAPGRQSSNGPGDGGGVATGEMGDWLTDGQTDMERSTRRASRQHNHGGRDLGRDGETATGPRDVHAVSRTVTVGPLMNR